MHGTLTIVFDGAFWVAVAERDDGEVHEVAKHTFGAEPTTAEVREWVRSGYRRLRFHTPGDPFDEAHPMRCTSPKRAQREAARASRDGGKETRAQAALRAVLEAQKSICRGESKTLREEAEARRWEQHVAKKKRRHRGH